MVVQRARLHVDANPLVAWPSRFVDGADGEPAQRVLCIDRGGVGGADGAHMLSLSVLRRHQLSSVAGPNWPGARPAPGGPANACAIVSHCSATGPCAVTAVSSR